MARDTAVCAWLKRWKHWGIGASFLRFTDRKADIPFVRSYEERRFAERLAVYIGAFGDSAAVFPHFLSFFFSPYPYDRLCFIQLQVRGTAAQLHEVK